MKSFKMKALAVAVLGLAGFGMAGSAFAICPTIAAGNAAPGGGGAWTSQTVTTQTFGQSVTGGLNGTSCALSTAMNAGAAVNTKGYVTDASPQNEPRYRARFYVKTAGMTSLTAANRSFRVFTALATTTPASPGAGAEMVFINVLGGATPSLNIKVGDTSAGIGYATTGGAFPNAAGSYRIEFDLQQGVKAGANCNSVTPTGGCFRFWISDAASATTDAAPTGAIAVTNSGWSGVKQINLGLFGTSTNFRVNLAGQPLILDEFDSRRQTFIGL